ncbi:hypothetical protein P7C71_g6313, partial [Lecanoromycetidae sp. Uapishka_2]
MVESYLEAKEDHLAIKEADITASLRRCVLDPKSNIVPIFAGASFRNMGVQPLLDAVVQLLPSPADAPDPEISLGANPRSGPPAPLNTLQLRPIDVPPAVFFSSVEPHSLGEEKAVKGALDFLVREDPSLQVTQDDESGQTLLSGMGEFHLEIAQDRLINDLKAKAKLGKIEIAYREAILQPSEPDIYAFDREQGGKQGRASCVATVEPLSEDLTPPDLSEYSYLAYEDGNRITITINSPPESSTEPGSEPWDGELPPHLSFPTIHNAMKNGTLAALSRGINYPFQLHNTHVLLTLDPRKHLYGAESTPAALSSAARLATKAALKATALEHGSALMELVMNVTVSVDEGSLGVVVNDLSSARGGHIMSLDDAAQTSGPTVNTTSNDLPRIDLSKVYAPPDPFGSSQAQEQGIAVDSSRQRNITARVPLKEMVGYLKHLRSMTGGRGTFVMTADKFERVVGQREKVLLRELRGF